MSELAPASRAVGLARDCMEKWVDGFDRNEAAATLAMPPWLEV